MYCSNCGKQLKDDDKFCDNCGTPANVGAPESSIQEQEAAAETSADIQEPASEEGIREPEGGSPVAQENEMSVANGEIPEAGAVIPELEKKIMKNMEDELILEMPEAAQNGSFQGEGRPFGGESQVYGAANMHEGQPPLYEQVQGGGPPKKKKKTALIVTLSSIVAVLLIAVVVLLFLILSPENKLKKHIENRDWTAAATLYEESFKGKKEEKADEILRETVEEFKEEFVSGTMDYSTVKRYLKAIEGFWDDKCVKEALDFIRALNDSRMAFEDADKHMQREEYEDAIRLYGEVVETDDNYKTAQEQLEIAKSRYKEKLLEEARAYEEIKDYDSAIELVEGGLTILEGDAELNSRLTELTAAREEYGIDSVLAEAQNYAGQNNYFEAMETVKKGLEEKSGNDKLEKALQDYCDKYEKDILMKAEEALGSDENYEAAILIFDSALRTLDGDYADIERTIREKREEYVQAQLEKSERENKDSAIVGVWQASHVTAEGIDLSIEQFLEYGGMAGTSSVLTCYPSGDFHMELVGQSGDGTWRKEESGNGIYYLTDSAGDSVRTEIDASGKLHMDIDGVVFTFEKVGEA